MKQPCLVFLFVLVSLCFRAQNRYFSFVGGLGPSYFLKDQTRHPINRSWLIGANYFISNKNQVIAFNPGLHLQLNKYHVRISDYRYAYIRQNALNIHLDMLLRLARHIYLRGGLLLNVVNHYDISIVDKQPYGKAYYAFSNDSVYGPYSGTAIQAGFTFGLCFGFKLFKREQRFGIQVNQVATPLVDPDYRLSKNIVGRDVTILTAKALPVMLLFTLELNLKKREKRKAATTEEES